MKKRGLNGILSRSRSCSYVGTSHRISKDFRWLSASLPADSPPLTWVVFPVYGRKLFTSVSPLLIFNQHNVTCWAKSARHSRKEAGPALELSLALTAAKSGFGLAQAPAALPRPKKQFSSKTVSRAAAKHTTVAKRKCTTGVMGDRRALE